MTVERLSSKISKRRLLSSWANRSESGCCSAGGLGCGLDEGGSDNDINEHKARSILRANACFSLLIKWYIIVYTASRSRGQHAFIGKPLMDILDGSWHLLENDSLRKEQSTKTCSNEP